MKIGIGSKNPTKLECIKKEFLRQRILGEFVPVAASSGVSDQPKSIEETLQGARNRALQAYENNDIGVALESGMYALENMHLNTVFCVIYDGTNFFQGQGPGFVIDKDAAKLILEQSHEMSSAYKALGRVPKGVEKIGEHNGVMGIISKDDMTRIDYMTPAVQIALYHYKNNLEN